MEQQSAAALLPFAARLQGRKLCRIEGADVFSIPAGWAAAELRAEPGIVTAQTPTELEAALQDELTHGVFVPRFTFGWTMLERILRRNGLVKTIFWEE
jgi:hypothetical protein